MTAAGAVTYSYDANGNLTGNSAGMSLSYNAKDQTTSITPAGGSATAMTYTAFTSNALGLGYENTAGTPIYYTRSPTGDLIGERQPGGNYYVLTDGLGSVVRVIDAAGTAQNAYRYGAFGESLGASGSTPNAIRFAGGYLDSSGQYKNGARYLDVTTGTWTQPDPNQAGLTTPLGAGYEYALSDPVNNWDPTGAYTVTGCKFPQTARLYVPAADLRPLIRDLCVPRRVSFIRSPRDVATAHSVGYLWCFAVSVNGYGPKYSVGALWTAGTAANWCGAGARAWSYVRWYN